MIDLKFFLYSWNNPKLDKIKIKMLFTKKFIKEFACCRSYFSSVNKEINISSLNYNMHPDAYDVIVIGGGHAGCEAAYGLI